MILNAWVNDYVGTPTLETSRGKSHAVVLLHETRVRMLVLIELYYAFLFALKGVEAWLRVILNQQLNGIDK